MTSLLGLGFFGIGVIALIVGFDASGFAGSITTRLAHISEPESIWLLVGGALAVCAGLLLVFSRNRNT